MTSSKQFRYRYHYREFKFNTEEIRAYYEQYSDLVDITRIHADQCILGLGLTHYINYGMSSRKVVNVLQDVYRIRISHQTVRNYAESVSALLKDMVEYYPYELTHTQYSNETSKNYRSFKQTEERVNRTFKQNYYLTDGYGSLEKANTCMVLTCPSSTS